MKVFYNLFLNHKLLFVNFYLGLFLLFCSVNSFALSPENHLSNSEEQRARELFLQIKCPVCAGQVIESSDTEIARQLRNLVRQQIIEGKSDEQIKDYFVLEYGGDILNSPPLNQQNFLLWFLPIIFVALGSFFIAKKFSNPQIK